LLPFSSQEGPRRLFFDIPGAEKSATEIDGVNGIEGTKGNMGHHTSPALLLLTSPQPHHGTYVSHQFPGLTKSSPFWALKSKGSTMS
jgi:hypothetical protein